MKKAPQKYFHASTFDSHYDTRLGVRSLSHEECRLHLRALIKRTSQPQTTPASRRGLYTDLCLTGIGTANRSSDEVKARAGKAAEPAILGTANDK